jgi:hypothetical protein
MLTIKLVGLSCDSQFVSHVGSKQFLCLFVLKLIGLLQLKEEHNCFKIQLCLNA